MPARAMWKGTIRFDDVEVPVKLYSALEDRDIHFRMLDRASKQPIKQQLVNPVEDRVVEYGAAQRAWVSETGDLVILDRDELAELQPPPSRDIEILKFLPEQAVDHRWYVRPYYLGPDGDTDVYFALAAAMKESGLEGLARWTMRNKAYVGALRLHGSHPMLMSLRHAEEVVPVEALKPPTGKPLDAREIAMARQLINMLAADFAPSEYQDDYRERVLKLIEDKSKGKRTRTVVPFKRKVPKEVDLADMLAASLKRAKAG